MSATNTIRGVVALVVVTLFGWASALEVVNEPVVSGSSGDYVTLAFHLSGQGEYSYTVAVTEPWEPLSRSGRVAVNGSGFVSVTLRVPRGAPANERTAVSLSFQNSADASDTATGRGYADVLATAGVAVVTPPELDGIVDEPLELSLIITNRGNMPDTFTLTGSAGMWNVRFGAIEVALEPGEEREVAVVLELRGSVSSGYRNMLIITAVSRNDPSVTARAVTRSVFREKGRESATRQRVAPRLNLAVGAGVSAGVAIDGTGTSASFGYNVNPRLSGELSDYVKATAGVGRFAGTLANPFSEVPSRLDVGLNAADWDASASIGNGSYALAGGGVVSDWRLGGSGNYTAAAAGGAFGLNAYAVSQVPGLDLQFSGATVMAQSGRRDGLGASYRTPLGDNLVLSVGSSVSGFHTDAGYVVTAGINESLSYQQQAFDVTQTYSGVPLAGLHSFGLNGGLRSAGPFGVRASTSLQLASGSYAWRNSVVLSARPTPGVGLGVAGTWQTSTTSSTWSVRPTLSFGYRIEGLRGGFSVRYAYTGVLRGEVAPSSQYGVAANASFGPVTVRADATYLTRGSTVTAPAGATFVARAAAEYRPGLSTTVLAEYEYASDTLEGETTNKFGVSWSQAWTKTLGTGLSYDRNQTTKYASGATTQDERVALIGQVKDLGLEGLSLSAGYAVSSRTGLFTGRTPLKHDLSMRVGYTLRFSFDTPSVIVDAFGGRRGGEVRGVAFLDRDLDGVRGENEEVLAGVVVSLGGESTTTAADGSYRLRVPSGRYAWAFGSGLPASVKMSLEELIVVEENTVELVDLPFVPVASLTVTLFDDEDNDGIRGPGEGTISFGGVLIDGPVRREVSLDARGTSVVSDLVPGRYTVTPDPSRLPRRYRTTTEPVEVVVREGDRPAAVVVGAAAPPREVVTTFTATELAVIARLGSSSVVAGEEIEVKALVSGDADSVVVKLGSAEFPLTREGSRWSGLVTVPVGTPVGRLTLQVVAEGSGGHATATADVTVR